MAEIGQVLTKTRVVNGKSETLVELNDPKKTKVWRPTAGLPQKSAGAAPSLTGETPAGQISGPSNTAKYIPQFTQALQFAMDEAGKHRQASLIGMGLSAAAPGGTLAPGTAGGIVDMIRSSVGPEVSAIFGGATQAVSAQIQAEQQEREFQLKVRTSNIDMLTTLAEDGALLEMPESALMEMGKAAGLPEGTALAWKARLTKAQKQSDEKYNLELKKLQAEIDETKANTAKLLRPSPKTGPGNKGVQLTSSVYAYLEQNKGQDGYVSAATYEGALRDWIANGGTPTDFYLSFSVDRFVGKHEIPSLSADVRNRTVTPSDKSLTPSQTSTINEIKAEMEQIKFEYGDVAGFRAAAIEQVKQEEGWDPSPYI